MKFLRMGLAVVVVLGLLLVAGSLLLPASTHVERSVVIDRPPVQVFATVNSFQRFHEWSPWAAYDPDAKYTLEGPASGVGARMSWTGNRSVGSGSQEIVESLPGRRVGIALNFDGNLAQAAYTLAPEGSGTRLTWSFDTHHGYNPISRMFGLLFDSMIGPDYERGLAKLKALLESEPRPALVPGRSQ
ncbi:SRPBCC family protein [Pseudoxanthomonas sp. UTMC 1351]|uniref:SRPBCC family protein n=1 Tax=Pseudoxanthomonas sp. UTMC 1351 TaxID=2695853 RepID=UPI0034CE3C79